MPKDYKHRSEDEHGNPDDLFTEEEALQKGRAEGLKFVDKYNVVEDGFVVVSTHKTEAAAKKAVKKGQTIQQVRETIHGSN